MESIIPYDNDITRLYKYAERSSLPTELILVRARTEEDPEDAPGTEKYVLESLAEIVARLSETLPNSPEKIPEMVEIITSYSKSVDIEDIAMIYYNYLKSTYPDEEGYYILVNDVLSLEESAVLVEDEGELETRYLSWYSKVTDKIKAEQPKIALIRDVQQALLEISERPKVPFSPVVISSSIVAFSPTLNGRTVTPSDGIDIFDSAAVSKFVPYLRYNDALGNSYSKVYTAEKVEEEPNYNTTVILASEASSPNTIYMRLWHGEENKNRAYRDEPKDAFSTIIYHLDNNYLTVESPTREQRNTEVDSHTRTKAALPSLNFGQGKEVKVRGEFKIWGVTIEEIAFLDMILLEPIMNVYLYLEENIKPYALKKRLDIHYRSLFTDIDEGEKLAEESYISNYASVSLTLSQKSSNEETVQLADTLTRQLSVAKVPNDTPYIQVSISQAESRQVVEDFIPIFALLMRYYLDERDEVINNYNQFLPELEFLNPLIEQRKQKTSVSQSLVATLTKKSVVSKRANEKIKELRDIAPDLFVLKYARRCQCPLQPMIINPEDEQAWKQKKLKDGQERQVMPFPKKNPRWLFVCPDDTNPYPGVKVNTDLPNKATYPYIPCCFKKDQMSPTAKSKYRKYLSSDEVEKQVGAKSDKKISTRKILSKDKIAFLPAAIEAIVKRYSRDYIDIVRYGVIYSKSSLIHCVCVALGDETYFSQSSDELKEEYVSQLRTHISRSVTPSLMRQELYDYSDDEILSTLADRTKFLDPALFYRAVEETFNINLYVFSADEGNDAGYLEIPRHKVFHSRPPRLERKTVLLMKTLGSESDALEHPQCELIVDHDSTGDKTVKLFGSEMTSICHKVLTSTLKTLTWLPDETFSARKNIYDYLDHLVVYQAMKPVSQMVDGNGKLRALTFDVEGELLTVATLPSQPENLPQTEVVSRCNLRTVLKWMPTPSAASRDPKGRVTGLWFEVFDILHAEYVPVQPEEVDIDLPEGPKDPITPGSQTSSTARIRKLRRDISLVTQLVRWLFELARSRQPIDVDDFAEEYLVMDDFEGDSSEYYDFSLLQRRLPRVESVLSATAFLEPLLPTFLNEGRIVMYNALFADRVIKMLKDYTSLRAGLTYEPPEFISGFYETEEDFKKFPGTKLFIREEDLMAWLALSRRSRTYTRTSLIHKKIDVATGSSTLPYLYTDEDEKVYIIQNVYGGLLKALTVARTWLEDQVNLGPDPDFTIEETVNMIYGISSESTLIPIEDNTQGEQQFLKVVYYGTQGDRLAGKEARYGALLEIL